MIRKKLFRIIVLFLALDLLVACCCHCDDDAFYFSHCEIELFHLDHAGQTAVLAGSSVPKEAYGIRTRIAMAENECAVNHSNSFLFNAAYATSCDCVLNHFLVDDIVSIQVFTVNDFDAEHAANTDVSDYFMVLKDYEYIDLDMFARNGANDAANIPLIFDMFLLTPPSLNETHQFLVRVDLTDDRVLELRTDTILLN